MSRPLPYRPPAWPGLTPVARQYVPAPADLAAGVTTALGYPGPVWTLANASQGSTRALRVDGRDGERLFVKLVPADWLDDLMAGEAIARWLEARGARVVAAIDGPPPKLATGEFAVAYPFCEGGAPGSTPADAKALGVALAALHRALEPHPGRAGWQTATAQRLRRLTEVRGRLARGELKAGPEPERLARLASDQTISFLPDAFADLGPSRPTHGDLNIFNILLGDHGMVFLDFEDVVHSVLPAAFDVALLCERAILAAEPDDAAARESIAVLLSAYAEAGGSRFERPLRLADILRGLALRSLCTLASIDPAGTDPDEWSKFFHLGEMAGVRCNTFA